ncbi:hypothetical protein [Pseudoduganella albidiflava]|uniref:Pyridoxamine 5'-phosphate oxidase putative domain-containing protein n=1 Tax=Pseudoduganella albidiflava TaxID=321983 RepID=A0A411X453_9BURK|nr:hypothetical protein [Pseudoduganella albidiflava]QBI03780.1 hypothetical protein EYF70_25395 [Pseudoduganella albidiflava]GGY61670.1 hypothetical protein GCM10007387_50300 [Pseudoduganella albidiflava]
MQPTVSTAPLDPGQIAFMQGGISISVGACGRDGMPQLVRAIGCKVAEGGASVTVFVPESRSQAVQRDVFANGAIAVVFTQPSTHRTMQLKSREGRVTALTPGDLALVDAYREAFLAELLPMGFTEPMVRAFLACPPGELVGLTFRPTAAFTQTPGPNAGKPLEAGA